MGQGQQGYAGMVTQKVPGCAGCVANTRACKQPGQCWERCVRESKACVQGKWGKGRGHKSPAQELHVMDICCRKGRTRPCHLSTQEPGKVQSSEACKSTPSFKQQIPEKGQKALPYHCIMCAVVL
eukprot:scaffold125024_cov18-Tisochrysis_lutea.AAC.1